MTTKRAVMNVNQTAAASTVRFHRVLKAPPERIYRAVLDPAANSKWLPPHGFTCTVHHMDAKVRTTYTLTKVSVGTEVNIVQENIPGIIPPEACYLGWQESLELLAKLVEPEIPNQ